MNQHVQVAFTAPEKAELIPLEYDPSPPGRREVLGPTVASLISAGTEGAHYRKGTGLPGYASVFRVEEVGSAVEDLRPGQYAFCMGRHRSLQRFPREKVIPLPAGLAPEQAVFARLMSVSMSTLTTTAARPPECVMVTGLGLVGHLAAQIFASCGYRVVGVDPTDSRRRAAQEAGVDLVLPSVPVDDPACADRIALSVDCSGHEQAVLDACRTVRKGGEVVLIGTPWVRRTDLFAHALLDAVFHRYVHLRSGWEWQLPLHEEEFRHNSVFGNLEGALRWLAEGRVRVDGLYDLYSPADAQQAYQDLAQLNRLGIVFDWSRLG